MNLFLTVISVSGSLVVLTNNKQSYQQWLHYPSSSKYNRACSALINILSSVDFKC